MPPPAPPKKKNVVDETSVISTIQLKRLPYLLAVCFIFEIVK